MPVMGSSRVLNWAMLQLGLTRRSEDEFVELIKIGTSAAGCASMSRDIGGDENGADDVLPEARLACNRGRFWQVVAPDAGQRGRVARSRSAQQSAQSRSSRWRRAFQDASGALSAVRGYARPTSGESCAYYWWRRRCDEQHRAGWEKSVVCRSNTGRRGRGSRH